MFTMQFVDIIKYLFKLESTIHLCIEQRYEDDCEVLGLKGCCNGLGTLAISELISI